MIAKEAILAALHERHACKVFDAARTIPDDDMTFILETGRLSPSSFGMEHWRFLVIRSAPLREVLRPMCWNQPQITSCSHLVVILAKTADVRPGAPYTREMFARRNLAPDALQAYLERYDAWIGRYNEDEFVGWSKRQCFLAASTMMTAAAMIGIDSCPIEGFEAEKIEEALHIDTSRERAALLLPFGYRVNPATPKLRQPLDTLVEYR